MDAAVREGCGCGRRAGGDDVLLTCITPIKMLRALPSIPLIRKTEAATAPTTGRADGRQMDQLRPLKLRTGVISCAAGSAMLELAQTKVVCSVYGPHATEGREYLDKGQLECSLRFASFARRARADKRHGMATAEEKTLSLELAAALFASVQLHLLPKSTIAVHVLVLHDDGGVLPAAISCASLALADASIHLYGLVACASCALLPRASYSRGGADEANGTKKGSGSSSGSSGGGSGGHRGGKAAGGKSSDGGAESDGGGGASGGEAALDASSAELASAVGTVHVACMPSLDQMTLLRHEGTVPFEQLTDAMERALAGCAALHEQMAKAIKEKVAAEEAQEDGEANESSVEEMKRKRPREA